VHATNKKHAQQEAVDACIFERACGPTDKITHVAGSFSRSKRVQYPQTAYSLTLAQLSVLVNPQKPLPSQLGRQGFKHPSDRQVIWGFCSDRVTIESGGRLSIASLSEVAG
jgi:hypothetical protein